MDELQYVATVRAACVEGDGHDPLDEAAALRLKNHGLDGAQLATEPGGFALVLDGELTLAVTPEARGSGVATRLLADSGRCQPRVVARRPSSRGPPGGATWLGASARAVGDAATDV